MERYTFKVLGIVDAPGQCELCGTMCPRRRVAVELIDREGDSGGDVQYWGVVCAAEARSGRRSSSIARMLREEAVAVGTYVPGQRPARASRAAGRVSTRRPSAAAAAAAQRDALIVWNRTASPLPAGFAGDQYDAADYRYRQTGRQTAETHYVTNHAGDVARVDGRDPLDVARFAGRGFAHRCGRLEELTATA